jgi:HK97 family phage prohead protease
MEVRNVDAEQRIVEGLCVPYNETTYCVPGATGERILRNAFRKSIEQTGSRVLLYVEHKHEQGAVGRSVDWLDSDEGLRGRFHLRPSESGDAALADFREGYLPFLSVGFKPLQERRAADGVTEVVEARLLEVSGAGIGAYSGALVESVRHVIDDDEVAAALAVLRRPPLQLDLSPIPRVWG